MDTFVCMTYPHMDPKATFSFTLGRELMCFYRSAIVISLYNAIKQISSRYPLRYRWRSTGSVPVLLMHVAKQLERLQRGELLDCATFLALCDRVKDIMVQDDNIVHISSPVTICGDIHGQFYDLLELFKLSDAVPSTHYIFLGDFVDRGAMSVETIALLCIFKVLYPSAVTLLRGNHESRQTTAVYGFQMECLKKYDGDPRPYKACMDMFDFLPLGALVDQHLFCLHGGLSPAIHHLDQLRMIHRFMEIPADGPFADIVWSDPDPKNTGFHLVRVTRSIHCV